MCGIRSRRSSSTSRKPAVVTSAVGLPRRSSTAFVATVVPWTTSATAAAGREAADRLHDREVVARRRREQLANLDPAVGAVEDHVGEGAADVDADAGLGVHSGRSRRSARRLPWLSAVRMSSSASWIACAAGLDGRPVGGGDDEDRVAVGDDLVAGRDLDAADRHRLADRDAPAPSRSSRARSRRGRPGSRAPPRCRRPGSRRRSRGPGCSRNSASIAASSPKCPQSVRPPASTTSTEPAGACCEQPVHGEVVAGRAGAGRGRAAEGGGDGDRR